MGLMLKSKLLSIMYYICSVQFLVSLSINLYYFLALPAAFILISGHLLHGLNYRIGFQF